MPNGAGHDAQDVAQITRTGMIYIPSKGGISHSPGEYTSPQNMANGANVLLHTVLVIEGEFELLPGVRDDVPKTAYSTAGNRGQYVVIVSSHDTVVVGPSETCLDL